MFPDAHLDQRTSLSLEIEFWKMPVAKKAAAYQDTQANLAFCRYKCVQQRNQIYDGAYLAVAYKRVILSLKSEV